MPETNEELKKHNTESDDGTMATMCGIMSMAQVCLHLWKHLLICGRIFQEYIYTFNCNFAG